MKKIILSVILFTASASSLADSLQNQISAVAQAQQQGVNEENRERDAQQAILDREAQQESQKRAYAAALAERKAKAIAAERKMRREKIEMEAANDKKRDELYEDELRNLEIQKQKLAVAKEDARVKRENEYIDQELKNQAAHTDLIQSNADSNRNLSEGGKDLMKSVGQAEEKKESSWFK
jgi:hypothetical protein